jgi:hypothetical protein
MASLKGSITTPETRERKESGKFRLFRFSFSSHSIFN